MSSKIEAFKDKVIKLQQQGDIASLYVLEQEAHETLQDSDLTAFYANILELALENLTNALEVAKRFNLNEVQDFATIRALYEYAIEHYSAKSLSDASALFEILVGLSEDDKFSKSMKVHQFCANESIDFDEFLQDYADIEATQNAGTFYISAFSDKGEKILKSLQVSEATK
jgi:hypothetical protein